MELIGTHVTVKIDAEKNNLTLAVTQGILWITVDGREYKIEKGHTATLQFEERK